MTQSSLQKCNMVEQGYQPGSCTVQTKEGSKKRACDVTFRKSLEGLSERIIKSMHLSRPEDYFSIYQSGCNHSCLKCHSYEFSKHVNGIWKSSNELAEATLEYYKQVTVFEPRERATTWHANDLCRHCGSCILTGEFSEKCPKKLKKDQVILSPQGFGPARNIVAFTGGDIMCKPDYYVEVTKKIKAEHDDLWVLLETNGYGLTPKNLEEYASAGVDSFWLDIKAFSNETYRKLCGTSNKQILESVQRIIDLDFTLEILTLYIPGLVETDEHEKIAELINEVDSKIPTTLLAFFPCYKLSQPVYRGPTVLEMVKSFQAMRTKGIENMRIGNLGVFVRTTRDLEYLEETLGPKYY